MKWPELVARDADDELFADGDAAGAVVAVAAGKARAVGCEWLTRMALDGLEDWREGEEEGAARFRMGAW